MEVTSVNQLCKQLISFAIQRCRSSGDPCRLSVVIRRSRVFDRSVTEISISDTGAGSCLKEFQDLRYVYNRISSAVWDGLLSITTTGIGDSELFHYDLNLKESSPGRRLTKLPATSKNNAIFSGTEVSFSTAADIEVLHADVTSFFKKILILKICNIVMELVGEFVQNERKTLATELISPPLELSIIEQLTSGLEDYVHRHRYLLPEKCPSCFPERDNLKMGSGLSCEQKNMNDVLVAEAVIMISEAPDPSTPSCLKAFESRTEVLYFRDFAPCSGNQAALKALRRIKWTNYGLNVRSITDEESSIQLEWENLPPNMHIDIVLHFYSDQVVVLPLRKRAQLETKLMKEAISLALDDMKEKYSGVLLSAHAVKIHSYAPDLARSIAGLILSSNDSDFQGECLSMLGLDTGNVEGELVEECIKQKVLSAIDINDRKPPSQRSKDVSVLSRDEKFEEPEFLLDEYELEEDGCTSMDL